jgi:hypothetical protein
LRPPRRTTAAPDVTGRLGQFTLVMLNPVYLALAAFIAWGRFGPESFTT